MNSLKSFSNKGEHNKAKQLLLFSPREQVRNIIAIGLIQLKYKIIDSGNPYIAVLKGIQYVPDLVIIDITDTEKKGFLLVPGLQKSIQTETIPILLLIPAEPINLLDNLADEYMDNKTQYTFDDLHILRYPFNFADMVAKIKEILR